MWTIIPDEKLSQIWEHEAIGDMYCECGHFNCDKKGIPYAYDEENNDIIFAYKCEKCGIIMYVRN